MNEDIEEGEIYVAPPDVPVKLNVEADAAVTPSSEADLISLPNDSTSSSTVEGTSEQLDDDEVFGINTKP